MTMSIRPRADTRPVPVVIALGSNLGDRGHRLREALTRIGAAVRPVRISSVWQTAPVDSPPGSPEFLNAVVLGTTRLGPHELLGRLAAIEKSMGRVRSTPNAPRPIDIDLILYGAALLRTGSLTIPHPRYREREFVLAPLRELNLPWIDPVSGDPLSGLRGSGQVETVAKGWRATCPSPRWRNRR